MSNTFAEFNVCRDFIKDNKHKICLVCDKPFKEFDVIIFIPIQQPEHGYATVMTIPIHRNCYWIKKEIS